MTADRRSASSGLCRAASSTDSPRAMPSRKGSTRSAPGTDPASAIEAEIARPRRSGELSENFRATWGRGLCPQVTDHPKELPMSLKIRITSLAVSVVILASCGVGDEPYGQGEFEARNCPGGECDPPEPPE